MRGADNPEPPSFVTLRKTAKQRYFDQKFRLENREGKGDRAVVGRLQINSVLKRKNIQPTPVETYFDQ